MKIRNIKYILRNPKGILLEVFYKIGWIFPDKLYLKLIYYINNKEWINIDNPKTFNEKLQWLKLNDHRPEYTIMVDKYAVKDYVANIIGKEFVIPTIGVWDRPESIDWDSLPCQFVLKTTHGGGNTGVVICKDKTKLDKKGTVMKLKKALCDDIYKRMREWPYKNVPKRIIAEKYIKNETGNLVDYKFFCFNGVPKFCQVITGRNTRECIDFFDHEWTHQPFNGFGHFPFADVEPVKPKNYELMWDLAKQLAANKPFCRIDLYDADDKVYFGEITFYPTSGLDKLEPKDWEGIFDSFLLIPNTTD